MLENSKNLAFTEHPKSHFDKKTENKE